MGKYSCEKCAKYFSQKSHYDKHITRKTPCEIQTDKIKALIDNTVEEKLIELKKKMISNNTENNIIINMTEQMDISKMNKLELLEKCKELGMDYAKKTRKELIALCKEKKIKGYSGKKKEEILTLIQDKEPKHSEIPEEKEDITNKKNKGQFYTTNSSYILDGFSLPPTDIRCIVEPFAGKGDLIEWIKKSNCTADIQAFDIEPKGNSIKKRDTLLNPPDYTNAWIITNPPYLARNKSTDKSVFDLYETNDLYKCFITSVVKQNNCRGGIFIIPAGFFFSPRDIDVRCRDAFMKKYKITKVKYFEESVFDDTTTTIVAFSFEKSDNDLHEQNVEWVMMPSNIKMEYKMSSSNDWIIGGDIYNLSVPENIRVRRHVEGQKLRENEQQLHITLNALDSGTKDGRISLSYNNNYIYPAKECSRTYASFRITGKMLNENQQIQLCREFNDFIEKKRHENWSLFLPQFRESKEYARKRIPFELAYRIFLHLIHLQTPS
jgi:hypothetical protein